LRVVSIDFTTRDKDAILADARRAIPLYTPEWTDTNASDLGIVLLTNLAQHLDVLHYYVDKRSADLYWTTAFTRAAVVRLGRLIDFALRSIVPASVDVTFSLAQTLSEAVTIPLGTKIQTVASQDQTPVVFETTAAVVIPALSLNGTVAAIEGESDSEDLGVSSGQAFQSFAVTTTVVVEDSLSVLVDEGSGEVQWTLVTSFISSLPTDLHYRIERDENEAVTVFFGDGFQGKIPVATAPIRAAFRKIQGDRGGVFGNVGANTIRIVQDVIFVNGRRVTVLVTNVAQASGGEDRQSIEEAKRLGPASLRALNRAVTVEDYKTLVEQFGGVAKARVTQGLGTDPCCACALDIYVAPTGGGNASTLLKNDILAFLEDKKMVGTCLEIKDPNYVAVELGGSIFISPQVNQTIVEEEIAEALAGFFSLDGAFADFGRDMYVGNLFAALEQVNGVDHVNLDRATRVPVPVLSVWAGDGSFGTIVPGTTSKDETWTVTFTSPTTFSVVGSVSGINASGTVGVQYVSDDGEITFLLSAGAVPNVLGDQATFVTSPLVGNVPLDPTEIMAAGPTALVTVIDPTSPTGTSCA
jgi:hypothetical protein